MVNGFVLRTTPGAEVSTFVNLNMPSGTVIARLYLTPASTGVEALLPGGIVSVQSSGVYVLIPAAYATTTYLPGTLRLQLSNDAGVTWTDYSVGQAYIDTTVTTTPSVSVANPQVEVANDSGNALPVTVTTSINSKSGTATTTGTITGNGQTVVVDASGYNSFAVYFSSSIAATFTFEVSPDGTNWYPAYAQTKGAGAIYGYGPLNTFSPIGATVLDVTQSGAYQFRVRTSSYTSGSVNITVVASDGVGTPYIGANTILQNGNLTVENKPSLAATANFTLTTAATTNATSHKNALSYLMELTISNPTATAVYVKFFDKASAPTVGTNTPIFIVSVPANSEKQIQFGETGKKFSLGIASASTGAQAALDTTAAVAGVIIHGTYMF